MLHVLHERDFKTLFVEKYKQLYYFAFDYLKDGDECRDIVSEVFAAVWNRHSKIDRKKIDSYLYSSVRNKCIDHLRQKDHIRKMSSRTRYVLYEKYFNDRSYKEIAALLGISVDGVSKILTRAFARLRKICNAKNTKK